MPVWHRRGMVTLRPAIVELFLGLCLLLTERGAERYGDTLQIALPAAAFGCAVAGGGGLDYVQRYGGMWLTLHGLKNGLGEAEINQRPSGGHRGFPSGHTASAVFGASSLANACVQNAPALKLAVTVGAAFVPASRIEAGAHDIWQALAGALLALMWERGFRSGSPSRRIAVDIVARLARRARAVRARLFVP